MGATTSLPPDTIGERSGPLEAAALAAFAERGYHVVERFHDRAACAALMREIDDIVDQRAVPVANAQVANRRWVFEWPLHLQLLKEPRLIAMVRQLMGGGFTFHHLHTARHDAGCDGVSWHHDYEQIPHANRAHLMVHVFFYPNGLDGTIGDLLVVPGSHRMVMDRSAFNSFGTGTLPGELAFDRLPPGSAVIVHSGLLHARRPRPGGEARPRYFIDSSYCQTGSRWPGYYSFQAMLERARALGLAHPDVPELADPARFFGQQEGYDRLAAINRGSLIERL